MIQPLDGHDADARLAAAERRLQRLDTSDPVGLLDQHFGELTLREMIDDAAHLELMQQTLAGLEERFGDPSLLRLGQPIRYEGAHRTKARDRKNRWIMLVDPVYPRGGEGPAPLGTSQLLYSHLHRGILAGVDLDNEDNPGQILWGFQNQLSWAPEDGFTQDCVPIVDGLAKFQLRGGGKHSLLQVTDDGDLRLTDAPLAVGRIGKSLAKHVKVVAKRMRTADGAAAAPLVDLTV